MNKYECVLLFLDLSSITPFIMGAFRLDKLPMAFRCITLVCLNFTLSYTRACVTKQTTEPLDGYICTTAHYINITNIPRHLCVYRCMTSSWPCTAATYNTMGSYCLITNETCTVPEPAVGFIFMPMYPVEPCNPVPRWVPHQAGTDYPANVVRKHESSTAIVGRVWYNGNLLVANIDTETDTAYVQYGGVLNVYDVLVVDQSCLIKWVYYNSRSGNPLPEDAVIGGHVGSRVVYVARHAFGGAIGFYDGVAGLFYSSMPQVNAPAYILVIIKTY